MYTEDTKPSELSTEQEETVRPEPELTLLIEDAGMTACVRVEKAEEGQIIETERVLDFLKQNGVIYGIRHDVIERYCEIGQYGLTLVCAKGCQPVDGVDGKMEYFFKKDLIAKPQEREDGGVDYFDLGLIQNRKQGDVLCTLIPPEEGVPGTDVYGKPVAYKQGLRPDFPQGRNTTVTEDGLHLVASNDGYIEYKNRLVNIIDLYTVSGDVDHAVGNIDFVGTVVVRGDVREGFHIKAGKDVIVRGMVEGSVIEAKNDISIAQGMRGMGKGKLLAGGNICGNFFENSGISAKKSVKGETFMNCNVKAGDSIIVGGRRAALLGGEYTAGRVIRAKQIGSEAYAATNVTIQLPQQIVRRLVPENQEAMEELRKEQSERLTMVEQALAQIRQQDCDLETQKKYMKALIHEKMKIQTTLRELEVTEEPEKNEVRYEEYKIVAECVVYPGVKIAIGPYRLYIGQEYCCQKFYIEGGEIGVFPVSPADRGEGS